MVGRPLQRQITDLKKIHLTADKRQKVNYDQRNLYKQPI